MYRALFEVEQKANEVEQLVEEVKKESKVSFGQVLGFVHAGWLATQGMVRAAGGSIQTVFRTLVGTTLGAIAVLVPIFAAEATAGDYVRAALGMVSIGLALQALAAMQGQHQELSDQLRGANMMLHGVQAMIGSFNW